MNAKELYEIVKDVPESACPSYRYNESLGKWERVRFGHVEAVDDPETALSEAMVRYLLDRRIRLEAAPGGGKYWTRDEKGRAGPSFASRVEALAAAASPNGSQMMKQHGQSASDGCAPFVAIFAFFVGCGILAWSIGPSPSNHPSNKQDQTKQHDSVDARKEKP